MALDPAIDFDEGSGADISGWPHVLQCLTDVFSTNFADRVIREFYGSVVPRFLGENLTEQTVVPFFSAIAASILQWEPRYRVTKITPKSVGRDGRIRVTMEGEYRPRALIGDYTVEGSRRITVLGGSGGTLEVLNDA